MPGGVKLDFVQSMAVAVERAQNRRVPVGIEAELDGLRSAQRDAERVEPSFGPFGIFAPHRLAQHGVAGEQVIGLKRRRLVYDLEHEGLPARTGRP